MDSEEESIGSNLEGLNTLFQPQEEGYHHELYFSEVSHALRMLQGLSKQRESGVLCDVTIRVERHDLPCHRNVLAACSPYFMAMFQCDMKESTEKVVEIEGIESDIMKQLIDYAYTSDIVINQDNAQQLLSAANMIQIQSIQEACCKFLETEMDPSNCLGIHCFAEAHVCSPLSLKAKEYTMEHFTEVTQHDELLALPKDKLVEFLESDELNVANEDIVFQAVISWVKAESKVRKQHLADVLRHVRLPLVDPYVLFDKADNEPLLTETVECRALLDEAKRYYVLKDRHLELQTPRTQHRKSVPLRPVLFTIGGEIYNKNYLSSVDCFDINGSKWIHLKELSFPRCHHGAVVAGGCFIYIAGGFNKGKVVLNTVLRYEPLLDKWIKVACMLVPRARHGMATLDGYIYAIGGYDGRSRIDSVERYSPETNVWEPMAPMHMALSRCQACTSNGFIYVAGGTTEPSNLCVDMFQSYNPRTNTWTVIRPMPTPRCLGGLVACRGYLYGVGGTEEMVHATRKLSRYDPAKDKWEELAEMIDARFDTGVALLNNKIYVLSGHDGENSFYHTIEEYDIETDTWCVVASTVLPYGRCRFGCVAINLAMP